MRLQTSHGNRCKIATRSIRSSFIISIVVCVFCSGCVQSSGASQNTTINDTNPYAAEFRKNYEQATNPLAKAILKDGVITEAEIIEFADGYAACMADYGITWSLNVKDGTTSSTYRRAIPLEEMTQIKQNCMDKTGYLQVKPLYDLVSVNPNNLSPAELRKAEFECMQSNGLIDPSMSEEEYSFMLQDQEGEAYDNYIAPLLDAENPHFDRSKGEQYIQCTNNPLGARQ